jgi:hypothetical protein
MVVAAGGLDRDISVFRSRDAALLDGRFSHEWLDLGEMPGGPITVFMIRQASYTYGVHGLSLFIPASDVNRFRALIIFNGIAYLVAGPVFYIIDHTSGMPLWWTVADSSGCALWGSALLWLSWRSVPGA